MAGHGNIGSIKPTRPTLDPCTKQRNGPEDDAHVGATSNMGGTLAQPVHLPPRPRRGPADPSSYLRTALDRLVAVSALLSLL